MPKPLKTQQPIKSSEKQPFQTKFLHPKYWGIWLAMAVFLPLVYLPLSIQFSIGRGLGLLLYHLVASRRKATLINLQLAFPEKTDADREQMAKQVFINQGIGVFETLSAWFRPHLFADCTTVVGLDNLTTAQENGKAVLLLGAHYTMLDLGGLLCSQNFSTDAVYRPQNNDLLEWFIYNHRRSIFDSQIDHKDMRKLVRNIKDGHVIWYSPDQDFGLKQGVMADFFGVPAATVTAPRRLARLGNKANLPAVMFVHFYRKSSDKLALGKRPHYQVTITPTLTDYPSSDEVADATRVNSILEELICIDPTQWMWFHKRYKNGENGRTDYYN